MILCDSVCPCARSCRRGAPHTPDSSAEGLHSSLRVPLTGGPPKAPLSRSPLTVEQRNLAYACFGRCHLSLGAIMAAVTLGAVGTVLSMALAG